VALLITSSTWCCPMENQKTAAEGSVYRQHVSNEEKTIRLYIFVYCDGVSGEDCSLHGKCFVSILTYSEQCRAKNGG